ncbi:protein nanos isoform X2 [Schistocerca gregaria]|uniref:protein nanos isoform X2 n=1 Tax=Schistocerca gregaria TaxID=7010 RepID=UPI00211F1013|nr:protein nanos isoform X2 [Schistocerca gregaria]
MKIMFSTVFAGSGPYLHTSISLKSDVMAEFRNNGREVDNTPECSETSRYTHREVSKEVKKDKDTWCHLFKNNGSINYRSHQLKDNEGKIVCPVLQMYVRPIRGTAGSDSHTENYCPWNVNRMAVPLMNVLKSGRKATGDLMAEFRNNGTEVDNTPECSKTSRYTRREVSKEVKQDQDTWCRLCKNNGSLNYRSHQLKDNEGKIVCPVLQMYVCPICGATGPDSHTENYCPWNVNRMAVPLMNVLKSGRKATGKFGGRRKIL